MTVPLWNSDEAATATRGRNTRKWRADGVSIDSRTTADGDLFVALAGPKFDGHDYVGRAFEQGAAASVVARRVEGLADEKALLVVDDTMAALRDLAAASRRRMSGRIAAVTGSVGKTGTKEALRHVLSRQGRTSASASSLNNQWGVPLSLTRMPRDTKFGIFEVGMNHPGEISPLSALIRPDVAMITTVAPAHTAFFETLDQIADAKAEIFDGMAKDGVAVLNRDNPFFDRLSAAAKSRGVVRVISFGAADGSDLRLERRQAHGDGSRVRAVIDGRPMEFTIGTAGAHWAINGLAVLAVVRALGADVDAAARDLADLPAPSGRGAVHRLRLKSGTFTLIDDSYNANPASMAAAIAVLGEMRPGSRGRRIAVLGAMKELRDSDMQHAGLVNPLTQAKVDLVYTAGAEMQALREQLSALAGEHRDSGADLVPVIADTVRAGDIVMVKGSNASGMSAVVRGLLERFGAAEPSDSKE